MFPRRVAFRNDYCMACNAPRRAVQIRTLDVIHLYFIPLLPLGLWKRWCCCTCGMNPHQLHLTRRLIKTAVLVVFLFCTVFFFLLYP
jgi:hypothetical protein